MTFQREERYIVMKHKDIALLSDEDKANLQRICQRIEVIRAERGAVPMQCVVVESDWPEYEYVWGLIRYRMEGLHGAPRYPWHPTEDDFRPAIAKVKP